jgi:hypothetical protein
MKTISFLALSAAAGVALAVLANAQFLASFPAEYLLAAFAVGGIAAIMSADYGRKARSLAPRATVLRPQLAPAAPLVARPQRTTAYGLRRQPAIVERAA